MAVTPGAGEGAELALLTAVLEQGGRKLGERWESGVGEGARARAGFGGEGGLSSRDRQTPPLQADSSNDVTVP